MIYFARTSLKMNKVGDQLIIMVVYVHVYFVDTVYIDPLKIFLKLSLKYFGVLRLISFFILFEMLARINNLNS